jgi:hypothetical protein
MALNLDAFLISLIVHVIINLIVLAPSLWVAGRLLAGKQNAKFTDALWIVVLGTVIFYITGYFVTGIIATIILLIIWLALVKHFFDCGWLKALAISIIALVILFVIALILALIGIGIGLIPIGPATTLV